MSKGQTSQEKSFSLLELSEFTNAELIGNPELRIENVDNLESACDADASFLANPRYREAMKQSQAGVICIDPKTDLIQGKNYLISDNPSRTFQMIAEKLLDLNFKDSGFHGIHETAVIHPSAEIGKEVTIGPYAVVDQGASIGDRSVIMASAYVGPATEIGEDCMIYPHAVVREGCILGDRVILQPGAIIGSCGFGYTTDKQGHHKKLEQIGNVILEDDVEIGANATVDRARFKATRIGQGTKIDNLVQIGHNVTTGHNNIIVSQSGIAGSAHLGNNVFLGGQAGIVGHVNITDNVQIATRGGVSKSIHKSGRYGGGPVIPLADFNKKQVHMRKIDEYAKKIEELEKRLKKLEESSNPKLPPSSQ